MSDTNANPPGMTRRILTIIALTGVVALVGGIAATALLVNIFERKQEAKNPFFRVVELDDDTVDPAVWGKNFPLQYDGYQRTVDMVRTRFGGSEAVPRTPTDVDPRSVVANSRLEDDPRLKRMWAGYAFAIDFREERGHAYMLDDQIFTGRQAKPQPGTCLHCHASVYTTYKRLGDGDIIKGFEKLNPMPYAEARKEVTHPVACIDCHDSQTMQLRVTRPGFLEGIKVVKAAEGIENYDVNTMATRQEMRSFVCSQCHVEYYFKGDEKRLTYPWFKGRKGDEILAYYDEVGFKDWVHEETGAPMLKAQHPEFEMWSQGVHARSGVACADCHMPYERVGSQKISDHHVRSPLLNINNACQTCHNVPEQELKEKVERIQSTTFEMRNAAMDALIELIESIKAAQAAGASEETLTAARDRQRKATFLIDFVEAENSTGFHAPQEAARLLFTAMNHLRQGQMALEGGTGAPDANVAMLEVH
ncbi:MAG: cytochrome c-552 [Candidatus Hydrogenedentota bacterium]